MKWPKQRTVRFKKDIWDSAWESEQVMEKDSLYTSYIYEMRLDDEDFIVITEQCITPYFRGYLIKRSDVDFMKYDKELDDFVVASN